MTELNWLFNRINIGPLTVKNRITEAPMCTHYAASDGTVNEKILNHYEERARGGAGLIMVEFSYIDEEASKCDFHQLGVYDDSLLRGLAELAETIKAHGAVAGQQICHAGRQRACALAPIVAPSAIAWEDIGVVPKELTIPEIEQIIDSFGQAAARVKKAGFDLVEIHGAHGYLITEFLSADTNKRTDRYGGDLKGRMRFALEVVRRVREAVGKEFPISFRMSGDEYVPGGISLEEAKLTAKELEKAGVDLLHVSAGTRVTNEVQIIPVFLPKGYNLHLAQGVKEVVNIPVVAAGALGDPEVANAAIRDGKADMVSMARPLLADPHLPRKARAGNLREICRCIRCNDCVSSLRLARSVKCTVNFLAGKEGRYRLIKVPEPKEVLVIGGGPAGMEAARVATSRGHQVTLYEKEEELGGHLRLAAFLDELRELWEYYLYQLEKLRVNVILGQTATIDTIEEKKPDVVILAVGGVPLRPLIPGIDSPRVVTVLDVFEKRVEIGDRVLILGGDLIACEAAWALSDLGKELTLVDDRAEIPFDVEKGSRAVFLKEFARNNVRLLPGVKVKAISDGGAQVLGQDGKVQSLAADTIILALGFEPRSDLLTELEQREIEFYPVGDCRDPRKLLGAIHDGALVGWEI